LIAGIFNRSSTSAFLLRRSYRHNGQAKSRTQANTRATANLKAA
jgi:hypothetical protein